MIKRVLRRTADRSARWWAVHKGMTIRSGVGAGLKISTRNASANYIEGTNELPVQEALARCLKPGDIFYDIGANVGFFTIIGSRLVGPSGRVYAFEPVPENAEALRRNAGLNRLSNIIVYEKAVSFSSGKAELLLAEHPGGATLATTGTTLNSAMKGVIVTDLVCIDDLVAQQVIAPPSVVKIDVEGAELDVLRGMAQTIKRHSPVIIYEIDDKFEEAFIRKYEEADKFVTALGYEVTVLRSSYPGINWNVRHAVAAPGTAVSKMESNSERKLSIH